MLATVYLSVLLRLPINVRLKLKCFGGQRTDPKDCVHLIAGGAH